MLEMLPIGETAIPVFKAVSDKIGSLKANISLAFVSSEKGMVTASAQGTHCGFPSYELFVNDKELYTYDAQKCENLQLAIAGMVQEHVNSRVLTIDAVKK
jgi:hypothetical protein